MTNWQRRSGTAKEEMESSALYLKQNRPDSLMLNCNWWYLETWFTKYVFLLLAMFTNYIICFNIFLENLPDSSSLNWLRKQQSCIKIICSNSSCQTIACFVCPLNCFLQCFEFKDTLYRSKYLKEKRMKKFIFELPCGL